MALITIPAVRIVIDIPDLVVNNITIKRQAELFTMTYNQSSKYLSLSWIVTYPDLSNVKGFSPYSKESIADNTTTVDVTTGAILTPDAEGNYPGDCIGQYDWFNYIAETQPIKVHDMIRQYGLQAEWN
jgi:hypothetical protein